MSIEFYRFLHLVGIFTVILSLGGMCLHVWSGGSRKDSSRKWSMAFHGIGLLITFVAGFGLLARLGYMSALPGWAIAKLIVWLILGGLPALIYRKPQMAKLFWLLILAFGALNAWLAIFKPF